MSSSNRVSSDRKPRVVGITLYTRFCNWNNITEEITEEKLKDTATLLIQVDSIDKDDKESIRKKVEILKKSLSPQLSPNLKEIQVRARNPEYIKYLSSILKEAIDSPTSSPKVELSALLIDDFENKDRSNIELDGLVYDNIEVPPEYSQWGIKSEHYKVPANPEIVSINLSGLDSNDFSKENMELVEKEIDEWLEKIPDLTPVDKIVLVANYLQKNMQYVQGQNSHAAGKTYRAEGIHEGDYGSFSSASTMLKHHIGHCQAFSKIAMLMLNNPKMNVNCRLMGGPCHVYNVIYIDGKAYGLDTTWGVTRNPNRVSGNLKATEFFDGFILFGTKELEKMDTPNKSHAPTALPLKLPLQPEQFPREELKKSREKLEKYGIEFTYPPITYVKQVEESESKPTTIANTTGSTGTTSFEISPNEIGKNTENIPTTKKEEAQAIVNADVKELEAEENQKKGVSVDGE